MEETEQAEHTAELVIARGVGANPSGSYSRSHVECDLVIIQELG